MIQIISLNRNYQSYINDMKDFKISSFSDYESFDMFDINIIDLNNQGIWNCDGMKTNYLNVKDDLVTLKQSIQSCNKQVIVIMPMNYNFYYNKCGNNGFFSKKQLKNISTDIVKMLKEYVCEEIVEYRYDKCKTTINNYLFNSDFYFNSLDENNILITSDEGNKINTYKINNIVVSTLNIFETKKQEEFTKKINSFLSCIYKDKYKESAPLWLNELYFFDDKKHLDAIEKYKLKISELEKKIDENKKELDNNNKIKGILYMTGKDLNTQIINILENILNKHNDFNDIYEEDYKFISDGTTFIVETKGLNNEVSGQNVADAFSHLTIYEDNLEKQNIIEDTKCLFFVASERKKCIFERKKINSRQETIAKRNNTLIIDTPTFLNLYEDFLNKKISKEEIIKIFKQQFGVIKYQKDKGGKK